MVRESTCRGSQSGDRYTVRQVGEGNSLQTTIRSEIQGEHVTICGEWELREWAAVLLQLTDKFEKGIVWTEAADGP